MSGDHDRDRLAAYLDGELAADEAKSLQEHMRTCPDCAAEVAAMVALRRQTKAAGSRFRSSAEFRKRVQSQIGAQPRRWPVMRFVAAGLLSIAAMVLVMIGIHERSLQADTFREVADLHVADLASANPYDVVSSDRHTVKPWFQGKIPFAFNLPEFNGTEFALLGARLVYLHQQPAAQIVVATGKHKMSVVIAQETIMQSAFPLSHGVTVRDSFSVETWSSRGLRFFVISDVEKPEVQKLAQLIHDVNE